MTIALVILWHTKLKPFRDYAIVIDAGSSYSKIFVYTWPTDKSGEPGTTSRIKQVKSCSVSHEPITSIVNATQDNVKNYFDSAMTTCINSIPSTRKSRALIFLGATAGLRLFNITNPVYITLLLNSTRAYFSTLKLRFRDPLSQVRIISGTEEGLSGWISTNILLKELFNKSKPLDTFGVLDMGGASTQLSFIAPTATKERYRMNLFNRNYDVYSHSYLCYGQDQARLVYQGKLVEQANRSLSIHDPCLQRDYIENKTYNDLFSTACAHGQNGSSVYFNTSLVFSFIGTGDYKECKRIMKERFNNSSCSSSTCSFNNVYQPVPISSSIKFIAMAAWYSTFSRLAPNISIKPNHDGNYNFTSIKLADIKHAMKAICKQSWSHVHKPNQHRPFLCFNSMHDWTLFQYGFHMTDENLKHFQIIKTIHSNEIGWTLGYMINQTNYLDPKHRPTRLLTKRGFHALVLATVIGFLSLAAVITLIVLWFIQLTPFRDYAVVIDAGSSHSKIFIYTWPADKSDGLGTTSRISQVTSCDVPGGPISSINDTTLTGAQNYFDSAMTTCINSIPSTRQSRTLIFLGATAGLRLLNITDPAYITRLLNSTRAYFSTLNLLFSDPLSQVRIISGSEEGLSGWISTNILLKELFNNNKPLETFGTIDMGGASTQLSFIAPGATSEQYQMSLFNTNYNVYSHSYLCYGQDQIRLIYQGQLIQQADGSTLIDDPCLQSNYTQTVMYSSINGSACAINQFAAPANYTASTNVTFSGSGNYTRCQTLMMQRFNKTSCSSSNCGFDGVYQLVPISSSLRFVGFSAVYSAFNTLAPYIPLANDSIGNYNLASTNLTQIQAAIATICNQPWSSVSNPSSFRPFLCFNSMYHWTLFQYGYSMSDANFKNFQIVKTIDSNEIGWTLGYMINQTNNLDPQFRPARLLTKGEFIGLIVGFGVLLLICILAIPITIIIYKRNQKQQS
ncbi:unnamed protein product [Adineta steineri]|uniref:Ectonucleoside triphosphate diphosphohydrolase 1 n=1 Tax=Adineta steineri TaxID=433720 RepID=A0A819NPV8_9BILA|nr:unnamed protein product [Adineta steineri]